MKIIGITGGVGSGKSELLKRMAHLPGFKMVYCDPLARELEAPGGKLFPQLQQLFGEDITTIDGELDTRKMSALLFSSPDLQKKVNDFVHPAVKEAFKEIAETERQKGDTKYLFLEGALILEAGFHELCDEIWLIYAREDIRRFRLKQSRGYSDEKIDSIMEKQLSEQDFRNNCDVVIDNNGTPEEALNRIFLELDRQ